jgi:hypothetical protein
MLPFSSGDQLYELLPCFGGCLSLCLFTEGSVPGVYCHTPFLWGMFSVLPAPSAIHFVFQFCGAVHFWMLLSDLGDKLCDPLPAFLWGGAHHSPTLSLHCLSCVYFLLVWDLVYLLAPTPFSCAVSAFHWSPLLSVFDYSLLFVIQFCCGGDESALVYVPWGG